MRQGDTGCGRILAGEGGRASSPTERGAYWSAPSSSAPKASTPTRPTDTSSAAKTLVQFGLCIGALPEANPQPLRSLRERLLDPAPMLWNSGLHRISLGRHESPFLSRNREFARGRCHRQHGRTGAALSGQTSTEFSGEISDLTVSPSGRRSAASKASIKSSRKDASPALLSDQPMKF